MTPNQIYALRALHLFRNCVEVVATRCAMPLYGHASREVGLFLLEASSVVAHAAYALYDAPTSATYREDLDIALRRADEIHAIHTADAERPYQGLLETPTLADEDLAFLHAPTSGEPSRPSVDIAWRSLFLLLQDVDQTVSYGLAKELPPVEMLLLFVSLQLPAALVRGAFTVLDTGDAKGDVADAMHRYNELCVDAFRLRTSLAIPLVVRDYPEMPHGEN